MEQIGWMHFLGRAICHQIPERSFIINGVQMPVCIRDTGIYLGIFSSIIILFLMKKHKANMIPNRFVSLSLLLFMFPMAFDGITSYLDWRETNNFLRLTTGIPFGAVLPMFVVPLLNIKKNQKESEQINPTFRDYFIAIIVASLLALFFYTSLIHGVILSVFLLSIIILWFTLIIMLVFKLTRWDTFSRVRILASGGISMIVLVTLSFLFQ
ncbi:DUF2085 domain-containing protein [Aquibacillus albus]|uniref:Membrane protein n=1 Tax=Aquibacillus albus TaxID=1168171 RepID=A0ABS2N0G4_9BACI|nr:DUF2085 domain-containing protein [Aquibacillus albus]MBM7571602.1 putative membrane protein [Aquibacillus albus]